MTETLIKVRFELHPSDWHGHGSENLWASQISGTEWRNFQIMNSPFFARGISYLDIVEASPTENNAVFKFEKIVERRGHSTYMLIMLMNEHRIGAYWNMLEAMGCSYESMNIDLSVGPRLLYSVDVPSSADICEVYEILERGKRDKVWIFQEGYAHLPAST